MMFRIRRVFDDLVPYDARTIAQVQSLWRERFPAVDEAEIRKLPAQLRDPLHHRFRTVLFVAESADRLAGFALMLHVPDVGFCWLDYIAAREGAAGRGVGAALYDRVREEARFLGGAGLFCECLPADPAHCRDGSLRRENRARLRFYERLGARIVADTAYETPLVEDPEACPPHLLYDPITAGAPLRRDDARRVVQAILERKYGDRCPPGYIETVVDSFRDDPVHLAAPRYATPVPPSTPRSSPQIVLTVNDRHDIHHVRERGYVESPARIDAILKKIEPSGLFERVRVREYPLRQVTAVHDTGMVGYFRAVCASLGEKEAVYPYVFPIRNRARPPRDLPRRAGYYVIDTFTPLSRNAFLAARRAVDCALTAADAILEGMRLAYALVRPPGHHAERRAFGGFCYLNATAVAANHLAEYGKVAVLDIDYHHGNGTQDIFLERADVLNISIHGHPNDAYPYFSGFASERGEGQGRGYTVNYPLPDGVDGTAYRKVLEKAQRRIARFRPRFLVVAFGLDTAKGDPTGTWSLLPEDFETNGRMLGRLGVPTLVVQEGGYQTSRLGVNALAFFRGLSDGARERTKCMEAAP
jgi:acetoin utilization deacetylase AcuC-like enzyme/GNAT superfamily N-acetyltransferase